MHSKDNNDRMIHGGTEITQRGNCASHFAPAPYNVACANDMCNVYIYTTFHFFICFAIHTYTHTRAVVLLRRYRNTLSLLLYLLLLYTPRVFNILTLLREINNNNKKKMLHFFAWRPNISTHQRSEYNGYYFIRRKSRGAHYIAARY